MIGMMKMNLKKRYIIFNVNPEVLVTDSFGRMTIQSRSKRLRNASRVSEACPVNGLLPPSIWEFGFFETDYLSKVTAHPSSSNL